MSAAVRPDAAPLLSICLPCYNGGAYLRVVLEALVPQAEAAGDSVEVIVVDDCSTDDTSAVVRAALEGTSLRYIRNERNLGMSNNIVAASTRHARGEYVWVMSQHNVLVPDALKRLLGTIAGYSDLDAFYLNFRAAKFPDQWPQHARGGYRGEFQYLCRTDLSDRIVERWEQVLDARTSVATQTYAHIIRRDLITRFWAGRSIARNFSNALDTYSQTVAVASTMFGKPALIVGDPVMTIYDGAQTWGALTQQARVYLSAHPDLLDRYAKLGWKGEALAEAERMASIRAGEVTTRILREWRAEEGRLILRYLARYRHQRGAIAAVWRAVLVTRAPALSRFLGSAARGVGGARQYFLSSWRPARWLRARLK